MYRALWWLSYTVAGVWAQFFFPGMDFFTPGLVLGLQEERPLSVFWLVLLWVFLQEGMGSTSFGYSLFVYGQMVVLFKVSRRFFDSRSTPFIMLMGVFSGLLHFVAVSGLCALEDVAYNFNRLGFETIFQIMAFPVIWFVAKRFYPKGLRTNERAL